jgi:hypothetical protein
MTDFRALCDELLEALYYETGATSGDWTMLRAKAEAALAQPARRPKPPSLRQRALEALELVESDLGMGEETDTIRRALEQLDD